MDIIAILYVLLGLMAIERTLRIVVYEEKTAILSKHIVYTLAFFIAEYILISAALIFLAKFRVSSALIILIIIHLAILFYFYYGKKKSPVALDLNISKETMIVAALLIVSIFCAHLKTATISNNSDAGNYYQRAIAFMDGDEGTVSVLEEYTLFGDEKTRAETEQLQSSQLGLYHYGFSDTGEYLFEYHGLPTWPALMALTGTMFGVENTTFALTILLALVGGLLYCALLNLKASTFGIYAAMVLYAFSPLVIYMGKSTLSEFLYAAMILFAISLLTEESKLLKCFSALPIGLLGFIHVTTLVYMPLIFIVLVVLCYIKKEKIYGYINIASCIAFILSVFYADQVAKSYSSEQYYNIFSKNLDITVLYYIFMAVIILLSIFQLLVLYSMAKKPLKFFTVLEDLFNQQGSLILKGISIATILILIAQTIVFAFTDLKTGEIAGSWSLRQQYAGTTDAILHINIFPLIQVTGFVAIPFLIWKLLKVKNQSLSEKLLYIILLYPLLMYAITRPDLPHIYYALRYFFSFTMIAIFLLIGTLVKTQKLSSILIVLFIGLSLPFNYVLTVNQGNYNADKILEHVFEVIEDNSVVFVNPAETQLNSIVTNNLRIQKDCLVFSSGSTFQVYDTYENEKKLYMITQADLSPDYRYRQISERFYELGGDIASFNGILPLDYEKGSLMVRIYEVDIEREPITPALEMRAGDSGETDGYHSVFQSTGEAGMILFGPYARLSPGKYSVFVDIETDVNSFPEDAELVLDTRHTLARYVSALRVLTKEDWMIDLPEASSVAEGESSVITESSTFTEKLPEKRKITVRLDFYLDRRVYDLEIRLYSEMDGVVVTASNIMLVQRLTKYTENVEESDATGELSSNKEESHPYYSKEEDEESSAA